MTNFDKLDNQHGYGEQPVFTGTINDGFGEAPIQEDIATYTVTPERMPARSPKRATINQLGRHAASEWGTTTYFIHGQPVEEVQRSHDELLERYNEALAENAAAETLEFYGDELTRLIKQYDTILYPEVNRN